MPGTARRQRDPPLRLVEAARPHERPHLLAPERREVERHRARADGRQQVVGVLRRHDQDQVRRRLFQRLQQRVGGLLVGAVHVIDQEDAPAALVRQKLRAFLQQPRLRDRDLAQRAVRREGDEIRMRGEQQRIVVALVGRPSSRASATVSRLCGRLRSSCSISSGCPSRRAAEPPRQRRLADAFRPGKQQRLRQAVHARSSARAPRPSARCPRSSQT